MIKLKDLLTEGKISSDVERAAKKAGIKFKKKTKVIITNKFSNPSGDMKKFGKDNERVKMNSWMDYNPQNYEVQGRALVSALGGRYVQMKRLKYSRGGGGMIFRKDRKDKKTEFTILYARTMSGPYISYDGVHGE